MSRLKILLQRAARACVGVTKLDDGWYVGTGRNGGWCDGPFVSKRQAAQVAYQWSFPAKRQRLYINGKMVGYI